MARQMTSKEYLEGIRRADTHYFDDNKMTFELAINVENNECRKLRALEIIAETLISINEKIASVITEYPAGVHKIMTV